MAPDNLLPHWSHWKKRRARVVQFRNVLLMPQSPYVGGNKVYPTVQPVTFLDARQDERKSNRSFTSPSSSTFLTTVPKEE